MLFFHLEILFPQIQVTGQQVLDMFEKSLGSILQVDKDGKKVLDEGQPLLETEVVASCKSFRCEKVTMILNPYHQGKRVLAIQVKNRATSRYDL